MNIERFMNKITRNTFTTFLVFLSACATPVNHDTASGRPEVSIPGNVTDQVSSMITDRMINDGYNMTSSSKFLLVFEKPTESIAAALMFGSQYDSTPAARVSYTITESQEATRVVASLILVTNPGSAFEKKRFMDRSVDSVKFQKMLESIRSNFTSEPIPNYSDVPVESIPNSEGKSTEQLVAEEWQRVSPTQKAKTADQ